MVAAAAAAAASVARFRRDSTHAAGLTRIHVSCARPWMLTHVFDEDDVVICVDSLYAGNQLESFWRVNCNKDLIDLGTDLLRQVRLKRTVTCVHVKGHSEDGRNDRADLLV